MRYASVIIGIIILLIIVGVGVAFMRSNGANGQVAYGGYNQPIVSTANTCNNIQPVQTAQVVRTVPVYQAQPVVTYQYQPVQTVPVYQAAAYQTIPTYVVPTATAPCNQQQQVVYGAASVYPVVSANYYPSGAWYTAATQNQYYGYPTTRTTVYQNPGVNYQYQYQYSNTQTIPGTTYNSNYSYNYPTNGTYQQGANYQVNQNQNGGTWYQ